MKSIKLFVCAALVSGTVIANATILAFDDQADGAFTTQYAGLGALSDGNSYILGGIGNGDPGNWGLYGTNGSKFLGNNGNNNYETTIDFVNVSDLSMDISRSNGSDVADTWVVSEYGAANNLIGQQSGSFYAINDWTHVAFGDGGVYSLVIQTNGVNFHPYGVDNIGFAPAPTPEPASMLALGMGAAWIIRRRAKR